MMKNLGLTKPRRYFEFYVAFAQTQLLRAFLSFMQLLHHIGYFNLV